MSTPPLHTAKQVPTLDGPTLVTLAYQLGLGEPCVVPDGLGGYLRSADDPSMAAWRPDICMQDAWECVWGFAAQGFSVDLIHHGATGGVAILVPRRGSHEDYVEYSRQWPTPGEAPLAMLRTACLAALAKKQEMTHG